MSASRTLRRAVRWTAIGVESAEATLLAATEIDMLPDAAGRAVDTLGRDRARSRGSHRPQSYAAVDVAQPATRCVTWQRASNSAASAEKFSRASPTARVWAPIAPSALVRWNIGLRDSCAIGIRLR
jgi:hypothetical protein